MLISSSSITTAFLSTITSHVPLRAKIAALVLLPQNHFDFLQKLTKKINYQNFLTVNMYIKFLVLLIPFVTS